MHTTTTRRGTIAGAAMLAAGLWSAASGHALAGDRAQVDIIGFSADGRFVAFEQYGSQDGSGYPYSDIYVLDVAANDWVAGVPVYVQLSDDEMPEEELFTIGVTRAREQAMAEAAPILAEAGIVPGNRGVTLVHHPYSDLSAPALEVPFSIGAALVPWPSDENLMRLSMHPLESEMCDGYDVEQVFGLTLELVQAGGSEVTTLQHDEQMPESRGCATDYRIHQIAVFAPGEPDQTACCVDTYTMLVLIAVERSPGFEGPDTRYFGVTGMVSLVR